MVELVGFSQGVSLSRKDETINYLDFKTETGKTFRLPVPQETLQALMAEVYGDSEPKQEPEEKVAEAEEPPPEEGIATVFGEDGEPEAVMLPEEPTYDSEEEVPSL